MEDLSLPLDGSVQQQIFHEGEEDLMNHANPAFVSFNDPPIMVSMTTNQEFTNKDTNDEMDDKSLLSAMIPMETDCRESNDILFIPSTNKQEVLSNVNNPSSENVISQYDGKICRKNQEESLSIEEERKAEFIENEDKMEYRIKQEREEENEEEEEDEDEERGCARTDLFYCSFKTRPKSVSDKVQAVTEVLAVDSLMSDTAAQVMKHKTRKSKRKMAAADVKRKRKKLEEISAKDPTKQNKGIKSKEDVLNPELLRVNTDPSSEKNQVENGSDEVTSSVVEANTETLESQGQNVDDVFSHVNRENQETPFQFENVSYDLYLGGETSVFSVPCVEEKDSTDVNQNGDFVFSQEIGESQSQFDSISASQVAILDKIWESQENVSLGNRVIDSHPVNDRDEVEMSTEIQSIPCNLESNSGSNKVIEESEKAPDNLEDIETDNVESGSKNENENIPESNDEDGSFNKVTENAPEDVSPDSKKETAPEDIEPNKVHGSTPEDVDSKKETASEDTEPNEIECSTPEDVDFKKETAPEDIESNEVDSSTPEDVCSKKETAPEDVEPNEVECSTLEDVDSKKKTAPEDIESDNVDSSFNKDIETAPENVSNLGSKKETAPEDIKTNEVECSTPEDVGSKGETDPEDIKSNNVDRVSFNKNIESEDVSTAPGDIEMDGSTPEDVSNLGSEKETVPENLSSLADNGSKMVIEESENDMDNLKDESNYVKRDNDNVKESELQTRNDNSNEDVIMELPLNETQNIELYHKDNFPREETAEETSPDEDGLLLIPTKQEDEVTTVDGGGDCSTSSELIEETFSKLVCSDCPVDSEQMEKLESIEGWGPCLKKGTILYQPVLTDYVSNASVESPLPEECVQNKPRMYCLQIKDTVSFKFLQPGEDIDEGDSDLYSHSQEEIYSKGITLDPYTSDEQMEVEFDGK